MTSCQRNSIRFRSSQQLLRLRLLIFELTRCPSWALYLPRALLPELQRDKDTIRCGVLGAGVPGHYREQLTQTLIVRLLETHFFHRSLIVKSQQNRIELVTRPGCLQCFAYTLSLWQCIQQHHLAPGRVCPSQQSAQDKRQPGRTELLLG